MWARCYIPLSPPIARVVHRPPQLLWRMRTSFVAVTLSYLLRPCSRLTALCLGRRLRGMA